MNKENIIKVFTQKIALLLVMILMVSMVGCGKEPGE